MATEREDRQDKILAILKESAEPIAGFELAARFHVTRQVVVHDVALLRAAGQRILSTPRGYLLDPSLTLRKEMLLSVMHSPALTGAELFTFVDYGLHVLNVQVEHPIYGDLIGSLHLASRRDVEYFLEQLETQKVVLLSALTDGNHMHKLAYDDEAQVKEAVEALRRQGIFVYEQ